jgi:hypothetical protein
LESALDEQDVKGADVGADIDVVDGARGEGALVEQEIIGAFGKTFLHGDVIAELRVAFKDEFLLPDVSGEAQIPPEKAVEGELKAVREPEVAAETFDQFVESGRHDGVGGEQ